MQFDNTINLGHLLTFVGLMAAMLGGWYAVKTQVEVLTNKVASLNDKTNGLAAELKQQTQILERLGRQEVELQELREQIKRIQGVFTGILVQ